MTYIEVKLSPRKREILFGLIDAYIRRATPISSHHLKGKIPLSSASIRNELRELTELGLLEQVHPTGGRIPTSLAYRLYVNDLVSNLVLDKKEVQSLNRIFRRIGTELELLLSSVLSTLSARSNYMAYVTVPDSSSPYIRSVNLIELSDNELVIVLITSRGVSQSRIISTLVPAKKLMLGLVNERLNSYLRGKKLEDINFTELRRLLSNLADRIPALFPSLEETLKSSCKSREKVIYTEAYVLLSQPEFGESKNFREIVETITNEKSFLEIVKSGPTKADVDAIIGEEAGMDELREVSILISKYGSEEDRRGRLGLVGPKRLDYERTLSIVFNVAEALSRTLAQGVKE